AAGSSASSCVAGGTSASDGVCSFSSSAMDLNSSLTRDRQRPGHITPRIPQGGGVVELARCMLEPQTEELPARGGDVLAQLGIAQIAQLRGLHTSSRITNLVRTGSLCPASRMASRARGSGTPASSNISRPGLTTATHPSGEPLPEPIRVSAGFLVNDLSGYTLIQTLPPRLILRLIAIRAASICRLVIQPESIALRPNSPNCTFTCPRDSPPRRPRPRPPRSPAPGPPGPPGPRPRPPGPPRPPPGPPGPPAPPRPPPPRPRPSRPRPSRPPRSGACGAGSSMIVRSAPV